MSADHAPPVAARASEATPDGAQFLIPGVRPITIRDCLAWLMAAPLAASRPQKPLDIGLFDMGARNQLDLFDRASAPSPSTAEPSPAPRCRGGTQ